MLRTIIKVGITAALFVVIFWEFGGKVSTVSADSVCATNDDVVFAVREEGRLVSIPNHQACPIAEESDVVVRGVAGPRRFGFFGTRGDAIWVDRDHCRNGSLTFAYSGAGAPKDLSVVQLQSTCSEAELVGLRTRGFKVIPADPADILQEARGLDLRRFGFWILIAILIKLSGILGNALRWQLLLKGQRLDLGFRYLLESYFVGRWFGIVTPGTLGLDGYRLYDSVLATSRPAEATTVIFIDKVIGLISLLSVVALVFPLGWSLLPIEDPKRVALVMGIVVTAAVGFFIFLLVPAVSAPLVRMTLAIFQLTDWTAQRLPIPSTRMTAMLNRIRDFMLRCHDASIAYTGTRHYLVWAVFLASFGHFTTALMYWAILMGITPDVDLGMVLFSALLMTSATLVGPSVGGEGIREFVFVRLLAGQVAASQAFLFGHIGFWIEKVVLSVPGGMIYIMRPQRFAGKLTKEHLDEAMKQAEVQTQQT